MKVTAVTCRDVCKPCCTTQRQGVSWLQIRVTVTRQQLHQILLSQGLSDGLILEQLGSPLSLLLTGHVQNQKPISTLWPPQTIRKTREEIWKETQALNVPHHLLANYNIATEQRMEMDAFLTSEATALRDLAYVLAVKDNHQKWSLMLLIEHRNKKVIRHKNNLLLITNEFKRTDIRMYGYRFLNPFLLPPSKFKGPPLYISASCWPYFMLMFKEQEEVPERARSLRGKKVFLGLEK